MRSMFTQDEAAEIQTLYSQINKILRKKNYQRSMTDPLYDAIEAIEFSALKRMTGLDKYMTIEIVSDRQEISKLSIINVLPFGLHKPTQLQVIGNAVRVDGTVGVKSESAWIRPKDKIKRRLIDGSWVDLPNPESYLKCD